MKPTIATPTDLLSLAVDPGAILAAQGLKPDPWQREFLLAQEKAILLNCCRGAGKSLCTSAWAGRWLEPNPRRDWVPATLASWPEFDLRRLPDFGRLGAQVEELHLPETKALADLSRRWGVAL